MKEFVTIATLRGKAGEPEKFVCITGPEVPYNVQRQKIKELKVKSKHPEYSEIRLFQLTEIDRAKFRVEPVPAQKPDSKAEKSKPSKSNDPTKTNHEKTV